MTNTDENSARSNENKSLSNFNKKKKDSRVSIFMSDYKVMTCKTFSIVSAQEISGDV